MDLTTISIIVGISVGVVTILGTIFGWFGKIWIWLTTIFQRKQHSGLIRIPKKTIKFLPRQIGRHPYWWHMGGRGGKPAMQIVGNILITNICTMNVVLAGVKLKKPKVRGHIMISQSDPSDVVPVRSVCNAMFDIWVQPPVKKEGETFKAQVAILDQFGNEHWEKIEFEYK